VSPAQAASILENRDDQPAEDQEDAEEVLEAVAATHGQAAEWAAAERQAEWAANARESRRIGMIE
jgi:hypothetical protein